jgi:hypothetical protein
LDSSFSSSSSTLVVGEVTIDGSKINSGKVRIETGDLSTHVKSISRKAHSKSTLF